MLPLSYLELNNLSPTSMSTFPDGFWNKLIVLFLSIIILIYAAISLGIKGVNIYHKLNCLRLIC